MRALLAVAARSAWNRRGTLSLVVLSIALATALLLGLERLRTDIRASFAQAVSGTDLVVGARTGPIQLMLYAVFRVGGATNNIRMDSVQALAAHRAVAWTVPISLGDSHRGYPVLGTTTGYFEHFRYGDKQPLALAQGRAFSGTLDGLYEAVIGAEIAAALGYAPGERIVLAHGLAALDGELANEHDDKPFTVVGVLARTGTPVDRTVHVSLQALEAIHLDWVGGAPLPAQAGLRISAEDARKFNLEPKQVTAVLVGLKSRAAVFNVQRFVADYEGEPLMAVLPGVALDELWSVVGLGERALQAMSGLVAVVSLASLVAVVLVDTGYLFPETHAFADALTRRLGLNLHVYSPRPSAAILAARHGRLWEQGVAGLDRYHELHKLEPMRRALAELRAGTWLSGLRRAQSRSRAEVAFVGVREGRHEVHPIADWTDRDVGRYLREHDLPYHPLWERGYVSIGDVHSTRTLADAGDDPEATRFGGLKRECGLHSLRG